MSICVLTRGAADLGHGHRVGQLEQGCLVSVHLCSYMCVYIYIYISIYIYIYIYTHINTLVYSICSYVLMYHSTLMFTQYVYLSIRYIGLDSNRNNN